MERKLLEVLEEAIRLEREAADRYRHGKELASLQEIKDMFEQLALDEEGHERILKLRYSEIKKRLGLKIMKDEG
ncbi:MAG: rubrerythrin [Nitrospinota bacterium]|nr:rubrerythrin [Nitrospinota bacterium]MDH5678328.1 rubrerythrin [Nitrospinota bacterium]